MDDSWILSKLSWAICLKISQRWRDGDGEVIRSFKKGGKVCSSPNLSFSSSDPCPSFASLPAFRSQPLTPSFLHFHPLFSLFFLHHFFNEDLIKFRAPSSDQINILRVFSLLIFSFPSVSLSFSCSFSFPPLSKREFNTQPIISSSNCKKY